MLHSHKSRFFDNLDFLLPIFLLGSFSDAKRRSAKKHKRAKRKSLFPKLTNQMQCQLEDEDEEREREAEEPVLKTDAVSGGRLTFRLRAEAAFSGSLDNPPQVGFPHK